jgi:hypothetical protein
MGQYLHSSIHPHDVLIKYTENFTFTWFLAALNLGIVVLINRAEFTVVGWWPPGQSKCGGPYQ